MVWRLEFAQQQAAPVEAPAVLQQAPQGMQDAATTQELAPPPAEPVAAPVPHHAPPPALARRAPAAVPKQAAPPVREERERQAPAIVPQAQVLAAPAAKRAADMPPPVAPPPVDEASTMALPPPPAPAQPPPPAPAPSKPAMVVPQEHPAAITTVFTNTAKQDGTAATASTVSARDDMATAPPAFTKKVEQIRQALRRGGSRDAARKAVQALQRDFPGVALPDDLRAFGNDERP
jgi:hypothetical protein